MGDYRRVSELQDMPPASPSGRGTPAGAGAPDPAPAKPVLRAAAAKRANASVIGMIIALAVSIAVFLPVVLLNPAPKSGGYRPDINVSAIARNAADVAGFTPAAPETGDTFRPNYARWQSGAGNGVPAWEVGYITPGESFIGLIQTQQANPTWLLQQTKNAAVTGTRSAGGQDWELRDTGKGEKSMVLVHAGTTIVLTGTAQLDEFTVLAAAVVESLAAGTPAPASPGDRPQDIVSPSTAPAP